MPTVGLNPWLNSRRRDAAGRDEQMDGVELKRVHLIVGLIAPVIFQLTGAYMLFYLADEFAASDRLRFSCAPIDFPT